MTWNMQYSILSDLAVFKNKVNESNTMGTPSDMHHNISDHQITLSSSGYLSSLLKFTANKQHTAAQKIARLS